jgi:hypothetical protein
MKRTFNHAKRTLGDVMATTAINVKTINATELRSDFRGRFKDVKNNKVLLVRNRRQPDNYIVDQGWL